MHRVRGYVPPRMKGVSYDAEVYFPWDSTAMSHQVRVDRLIKGRTYYPGWNRGVEPTRGDKKDKGEPKPGNVPRYEPRNGVIVHWPGWSNLLMARGEAGILETDRYDPYSFWGTCQSVLVDGMVKGKVRRRRRP